MGSVRDRIQETLGQLALYRLEQGSFRSTSPVPTAPGDLATCEGLEAFLVPAVEGALPFSDFLSRFRGSGPERSEQEKQAFLAEFGKDVRQLVDRWKTGRFSGQPYAVEESILRALPPNLQDKQKWVSITEAAAMACRVLIHLLTLKLSPSKEESESGHFNKYIGSQLDDAGVFAALKNAIEFLVRAFQKGDGDSEGVKIVSAKNGGESGSGWSWTDHANLPPILFFTASAVDAFAELDLYLIRKSADGTWDRTGTEDQRKLAAFYQREATTIDLLQLCVEMSRQWVENLVLANISIGSGEYVEPNVETFLGDAEAYKQFAQGVKREGLANPPMILYNNLYALLILLWSYADWDEKGECIDELVKNKINRALMQIVYSYKSLPTVRQVLSVCPYQFYLPGKGYFRDGSDVKCSYLDSGFLPLLTRLLVLFVVYGVGDRNLLEPVIRDLYVELLQNRNREKLDYSGLWSSKAVEVFSTQRAIQALTFYYAYARAKEGIAGCPQEVPRASAADAVVVKNETGQRLVLRLCSEEAVVKRDHVGAGGPPAGAVPALPVFSAETFGEYLNEHGIVFDQALRKDEEVEVMQGALKLGTDIINGINGGTIRDIGAARLILNALARISKDPSIGVDKIPRKGDLELLKELKEELMPGHDEA